jgi:hypothetical protein
MKHFRILMTMGVMLAAAGSAQAGLIVNGGFETGDFTGWTLGSNNDGFSFVGTDTPHSGSFEADLGQFQSDGTLSLSQSITTTIGASYTFSFWMTTAGAGGTSSAPDFFSASFGGQTVLSLTDVSTPTDYTLFSYTVVATSTSTLVDFESYNSPWYFFLDDVDVVPSSAPVVPEPSSIVLVAIGICGLGVRSIRKRRAAASKN